MKRVIALTVPIILILLGLVIILYEPMKNYVVAPKEIDKVYKEELDITKDEIKKNKEENKVKYDYESIKTLTASDKIPPPSKEGIIGIVHVPSVGMTMPIKEGVTERILLSGVGTMKPDQEMGKGNYVLIGHNHINPNLLFAPIRRINKGDSIYVTDKEHVYEYKMVGSKVVQPTEIEVMDDVEGEKLVTLISCYSRDGSDRIVVKGELVSKKPFEKVDRSVQQGFHNI